MKNKLSIATSFSKKLTKNLALPLLILSTQTQATFAADDVTLDNTGGLELSITANRRAKSIDNTLTSVSVITRDDIEQIQAHDLVDVLQLQRGISISRNGGSGSSTTVFIRGSESNQVLVLLNGVRISSATTGAFNWAEMPLDMVERIEIVRGPRAALYGSDAIGGVIEITTRKNTDSPYFSIKAGKYGTTALSAGFSSSEGKNQISANISTEEADGFSATNEKAGQFTFNDDNDPHRKNSVNLSFSRQITDKTKAGLELFHSRHNVDYDQGDSTSKLETVSAYLSSDVSERWSQKLSVSKTKSDSVSTSAFGVSNFDTDRKEVNWQNNINLSDATSLILGANYRQDKGKSNDFDEKINNKAVYANVNNKRGRINLDLSARYDNHSQAGDKSTGQVAIGFDISSKTTAYANVGTAFKAPNINELFYPGFGDSRSFAGNINLEPETSKTFEVGLKSQLSKNQRLEASIFRTKVANLISFSGENSQAINTDEATMRGLEIGYAINFNKLNLGLDLSVLRTKNKSTGERLIRRPDNKLTLNIGYALNNRTHIGMDTSVVSSRDDLDFSAFPAERIELDNYSLINLSANHKINKHASFGLRLENVSNEDYELANGFNTPKRGAYLTFNLK